MAKFTTGLLQGLEYSLEKDDCFGFKSWVWGEYEGAEICGRGLGTTSREALAEARREASTSVKVRKAYIERQRRNVARARKLLGEADALLGESMGVCFSEWSSGQHTRYGSAVYEEFRSTAIAHGEISKVLEVLEGKRW